MLPAWLDYTVCTFAILWVVYTLIKSFRPKAYSRLCGWLPFLPQDEQPESKAGACSFEATEIDPLEEKHSA